MYCQFNMTRLEPNLKIPLVSHAKSSAVVIGAGLGGLSAAMRLGAKGYSVTLIDRLDRVGGRGSSVTKNGLFCKKGKKKDIMMANFLHAAF